MKKYAALIIVCILALSLIATPVFAGGNGAAKADLIQWGPRLADDPPVGWVIFNATASGCINVEIKIQGMVGWENYDVAVNFFDADGGGNFYHFVDNDVLTTNIQGNAVLKYQFCDVVLPASTDDDDTIKANVVIRENIPGPNPWYSPLFEGSDRVEFAK